MADLELIVKEIKDNIGGLSDRIDGLSETETKVSKVVDSLDELQSEVKTIQEERDANETWQKDMEAKYNKIRAEVQFGEKYNGIFPSEKAAETFGHFIYASILRRRKSLDWLEKEGIDVKAMSEGTDTAGGHLTPTLLIPTLIRLIEQYGVFRQNARIIRVGSDNNNIPTRTGGLTVYKPGEGSAITPSDLTLGTVALAPAKLATLTAISTELDEDSVVSVGELVADEIAQAFALAEDQAAFIGDGTSTYWDFDGIGKDLDDVSSAAGITAGAGNLWSELTLANFETCAGNIPQYADVGNNLKWYCHRLFYYTVMYKLALAQGGSNATEVLTSKERQFLGYPVAFVQAMPSAEANSQHCVYFANLNQGSILADRRLITVDQSRDVYFANDQIGIRGTMRVDIKNHDVGTASVVGSLTSIQTAAS